MIVKKSILIVEDEESIIHILSTVLSVNDYRVLVAHNGEQALMMACSHRPDLVLLDLGLPGMDGIEVLRQLRQRLGMPVIIVSARDTEKEKVEALDMGADDYITKPFGTSELLARIRNALRHGSQNAVGENVISCQYHVGGLHIDFEKHSIDVDGKDVHLTQIEFKIVEFLARQAGRVLTYDCIMEHVWGPNVPEDNKILRVNMANIRRKLEKNPAQPQYILTEMGIGYRMAEKEDN